MATRTDTPSVPPPPTIQPPVVPPVASAAASIVDGPRAFLAAPVVFRRTRGRDGGRRGRGRKKKYTRGTKQFQRLLLGFEEATYRVSNGAARGLQTFVRRSKRSRRRRRDGLVRDVFNNAGRGFQRAFRVGSRAPWDLGRRVATGPLWRNTRNFVVPLFTPFLGGR